MSPPAAPRGRRPGENDTATEILAAARALFAAHGFTGTTIRAVASRAGVDPALVHHYFGAKYDLFLAALQLPVDPRVALAPVVEGGVDGAGGRLLSTFLSVWDDEATRLPLLALVRGIGEPEGARIFGDGLLRMVLAPVGEGLGVDEPDLRMSLVASQLVGVVILRYLLVVDPLASLPADAVVAAYAPTLQRYLSAPLTQLTP